MQEAISRMLARYSTGSVDEATRALREILQEVALLGLWRAKFFEHAAFYGGTALRILYGLDRFSEDLDFSLLEPSGNFNLERYTQALQEEIRGFGFDVQVTLVNKAVESPVQSAFLKANTRNQLLVIKTPSNIADSVPPGKVLKIKLEVDTDPPGGFETETRYLLQPIPFPVRTYTLPDLFAGKMHAVLCRGWKNRVKGRDWYDFIWFVANHPRLHLGHLEQRMRQTGHWTGEKPLSQKDFHSILAGRIHQLNVEQARREVSVFLKDPTSLEIWSKEFFLNLAGKIELL